MVGNIVASTQTINSLFGARYIVPGTGMIPNNYMFVFDPHPGRASSIAPGKRITSSMSPVIVLRDGKPVYALGPPRRPAHFPVSVMQALSNLIDHEMTVQEAVEAARVWTQGYVWNSNPARRAVRAALQVRGHDIRRRNVAGGMSAIQFHAMAAGGCRMLARRWHTHRPRWRPCQAGVRFRPEATRV